LKLLKKLRLAGILYSFVQMAFLMSDNAAARTYTTKFPLTENPISESNSWLNGKADGLDWSDVMTTQGRAYGTESGLNGYDDSTAILKGTWGSNQTVSATVFTTNQNSGGYEEVELRLRSSLTANICTGYEVLFQAYAPDGYATIVRWNGPFGDFDYINQYANNNYSGITNGSVISASISNNIIIGYVNGVEVISGTNNTYTRGNPGMGFWLNQATGLNSDYGFTSFTASDELQTPILTNPTLNTNGCFSFTFPTMPSQSYAIQQTANLGNTNWSTITSFTGTGIPYLFNVPATSTPPRLFFRVLEP
jgi:hypothetical protein